MENSETAMTQVKEFLEQEQPLNRHETLAYSRLVRSAFEWVKKARADGFSFVQICGAFEKAGLLPCKAHSHSFRQAFSREEKRQKKEGELSKRIKNDMDLEKKPEIAPVQNLAEPATLKRPSEKAEEEARMPKKAGSTQKETPYEKFTKHSNGGFDLN